MLKTTLVYSVLLLLLICNGVVKAQCPVNIGFDMGSFTNWIGYTGLIGESGDISVPYTNMNTGVFSLITRASQQKDQYGQFSLGSPNGSTTVAKLGNDLTGTDSNGGNKAQRLTYTFTVPAGNNEFSLIYYYAIVLEDPPNDGQHTDLTKPKFTAAIFDVTDNKYSDCANFNFVSISKLPGFAKAPTQNSRKDIYYKDWSPVTIDLRGYAGKTLRLEFTTNNCAPGGHFGYAYIDVNANCTSPVSGNVICTGSNTVTLKAPAGFQAYQWYSGTDFSKVLSTLNTYTVTPAPPVGTQYSVVIVPYPGLGCQDTITTTVQPVESLALIVKDTVKICTSGFIDITAQAITSGSDPSFSFNYYSDYQAENFIPNPTHITQAGTYYIQANSPSGCSYIRPIVVSYLPSPMLAISNPPEVCAPNTVNLTSTTVTASSTGVVNLTYWKDTTTTIPLTNPDLLSKTGTYYIKASNNLGCYDIEPVTVLIDDLPVLVTNPIQGCNTADITVPDAIAGSTGSFASLYCTDAEGNIPLSNPKAITTSGTYYIAAITAAACKVVKPIQVTIYPYPQLTVTNPAAVVFPATVDITRTFTPIQGTAYSYYLDSQATKPITDPTIISKSGTYYIKAVNGNNCALVVPVKVTVSPPATIDFNVNTFTPNGDGKNDKFRIPTPNGYKVTHFRIYGSWGALLYDATDSNDGWDGTYNGKKMPVGTYYWIFEGFDPYANQTVTKSGSITLLM